MTTPYYASSREAETAFYDAFQRADFDSMMDVWADDDGIVCIHPMGPRLAGRQAVARSWEHIFAGSSSMRFELGEVETTADQSLAVHCVYEVIDHGPQFAQRSLVLATNVYKMTDRGWRMILHHASPSTAPGGASDDEIGSSDEPKRMH